MSSSTGSDEIETDPYLKLQKMKVELDDLSSRYTPKHPDVIRMKNMIADLERKIENGTIQSSGASESKTHVPTMNPVFAERRSLLMQQRVETNLEIRNLNADAARLLNQIAHYQKLVEDTPKKEQELLSLQRDYNNMNNNYKSLLDRKMQAQLAVNLEKKKKGEQFRILDRAQFPFTPVEPDMKKLFMLILVASVGLGGGLVFLLEYFDNSVRQVKDLESDLGITVLASIPKIYTKKDKVKYGFNKVLTYACLAVALVLCAGFAALVLNGVESTLELVQSFAKL
jgi:uncharacterized protein involved in exopolysaccharide biosynthesis